MQQLRHKLAIAERAAKTQQQLKVPNILTKLFGFIGCMTDGYIVLTHNFVIFAGKITIALKSFRRRT